MSARHLAAAAALVLAGCPIHPRAPIPTTTEGSWAAWRDGATRRNQLYDKLDSRANATATHLSGVIREARARRLAEWFGWTPQELDRRLAEEQTAAARAEEFLLAFYASDSRANDLDAPRSVWRIALQVGDTELLASRVTSVERDATLLGLFPFVGPFDVAYMVTFPRAPGGDIAGKPFVLQLSSALGKVVLDWSEPGPRPVDRPVQPGP